MKEIFIAFLDFLKVPVGIIIPFLLLKGRLKTFMLRDLISKKVVEIDAIKNKVRIKVEGASVDFNGFLPYDKLTKSDTEFARDFFFEVYKAAFHAERNLATIAMITYRAFERFHLEMDYYCKKNGHVSTGVNKGTFYQFFNRSVEYIESCAVRSIEFPTKFSVNKSSSYGTKGRPLLSLDNVNSIDGFEQGPVLRSNRFDTADYFLKLVGFILNDRNFLIAKAYFSAIGNNSLAYFFFVDRKLAVPAKIDVAKDDFSLFDEEVVYFIGLEPRTSLKLDDHSKRDICYLYYANISSFFKFSQSFTSRFEEVFSDAFGFKPRKVDFFYDVQVVRFEVLRDEALNYYQRNARSISYEAYKKSGKGFWGFVLGALFNNFSLSYYVFSSEFFFKVSAFGAACLNVIQSALKTKVFLFVFVFLCLVFL